MVHAVQAVAHFQHQPEVRHELGDAPVLAATELLLHLQQTHALPGMLREGATAPAPAARPLGRRRLLLSGGNAPQRLQEGGGEAAVLLLQELAQDAVALLQLVAQLLLLAATTPDHRRLLRFLLLLLLRAVRVFPRGGTPPSGRP